MASNAVVAARGTAASTLSTVAKSLSLDGGVWSTRWKIPCILFVSWNLLAGSVAKEVPLRPCTTASTATPLLRWLDYLSQDSGNKGPGLHSRKPGREETQHGPRCAVFARRARGYSQRHSGRRCTAKGIFRELL